MKDRIADQIIILCGEAETKEQMLKICTNGARRFYLRRRIARCNLEIVALTESLIFACKGETRLGANTGSRADKRQHS